MSLNYRSAKKIIEDSDSSNDENIPTSSYAAALKTKKRNCRVPKGLAPKQSQSCASVNGVSKSKTLEEKREEKKKAAEREKEVQKKQKIYMTTVNDYRKECKNYSRDLNAVEYTMDTSKMKSAIRNQCVEVEWDDSKLFIEAEKEIQRQIKDDPVLRRHVKREVEETANENVMDTKAFRQRIDILSKKSSRVSKKPSSRSTKSPHDDEEVRSDGKRFRMMTNLTTNLKDPIPVFDHLAEEVSNLKISESLFYVYSDKNILSERLKKLDKEFEKPKNKISCKCHTGGSLIKCWQNENCPCYKVNKELRKMQLAGEEAKRNANHQATHHHEPTDFSTFAPKLLNSDHFDLAIGFSCSEECGCKGCCTNNPTFILDKKLNKLEVVRKNNKKGFGVRILNHAKAGTVLCEFTGAINDEDTHDSENDDYAFKVVGDDKDLAGKLARALQADDRLTQMLEEVYAKDWFIDPKRVGNVARTINHSCEPNVELVRVFQKGFSPNHVRFLAVTTEDMFPGEELFLDYGENYFKRFLKNCLCRKLPCENNKSTYKPEILALKKKFTNSHHRRYKEYKRNVLDKLKPPEVYKFVIGMDNWITKRIISMFGGYSANTGNPNGENGSTEEAPLKNTAVQQLEINENAPSTSNSVDRRSSDDFVGPPAKKSCESRAFNSINANNIVEKNGKRNKKQVVQFQAGDTEAEKAKKKEAENMKLNREKQEKVDEAFVDNYNENSENYTMDPNSVTYSNKTEEMRSFIRSGCLEVARNDQELFVQTEQIVRQRIQQNPILRAKLKRPEQPTCPRSVIKTSANLIHIELRKKGNSTLPKSIKRLLKTDDRGDQEMRIRMMINISTNLQDPMPVYDHIAPSTVDLDIPDNVLYKYTDRNIPFTQCESLVELDAEFNKPGNKIRCNCHGRSSIVKCWENPRCPCYIANKKLRKYQKRREDGKKKCSLGSYEHRTTNFSSFEPILLNSEHFFDAIGFACSEECQCAGRCDNNSTLLLDFYIQRLEIVREHHIIGFGVRTLIHIPAGMVISEFTGKLTDAPNMQKGNADYAFRVIDDGCETVREMVEILRADSGSKLEICLRNVYRKRWNIDPKFFGNVARTFNHSCQPNAAVVRVFQKGFSPSHVRFLVVTTTVIFPGQQIYLDYGDGFIEQNLGGRCLCGTIACRNNEKKDLKVGQVCTILQKQFNSNCRNYEKTVLNRL